ncbi:MAG: hypothetical protein KAU50_11250, partial [Candidatus Marinimicrobia bacterium]|nr:hypothetical protein [Candidatus Neomarinimicrobiota bacterium]
MIFSGCFTATGIDVNPDEGELSYRHSDYKEAIQVMYLGTEGFLFRRGDAAIMGAPFYTNPGVLQVGLGWISPDTALIDWLHPRPPEIDLEAILVGHAHYDHL